MRDDTIYLKHILDAIARIESYIQGVDERVFKQNPLIQDGVIRQIEIIGEATKKLSKKLRAQNDHIPWQDIAGMRDKLIHDYLGVDIEKVWLTVIEDLPLLKKQIKQVLQKLR